MLNIEKAFNELKKQIPNEKIYINEPMSKHTSFKTGGNADLFVKVQTQDELRIVKDIALKFELPITIIGNGTNLLVLDKGIRGIVIKIELDNIEITEKDNIITIKVESRYAYCKVIKNSFK